mmetsp:Transcript_28012/g.70510  ORF Transcript_28012/g.70510 Transcript_28012/m.70510 type:complete len:207 (-) Transcript_28012:405-1025(-)
MPSPGAETRPASSSCSARSQGARSASVSRSPRFIFAMALAEWKSSASRNVRPSFLASAAPIVDLPAPVTPHTTIAHGRGLRQASSAAAADAAAAGGETSRSMRNALMPSTGYDFTSRKVAKPVPVQKANPARLVVMQCSRTRSASGHTRRASASAAATSAPPTLALRAAGATYTQKSSTKGSVEAVRLRFCLPRSPPPLAKRAWSR